MTAAKKNRKKSGTKRKGKRGPSRDHVRVTTSSYGKALRGTLIYWEGRRPSRLRDDGRINLGKNILEILGSQFERFRWIITEQTDSITIERGIVRVRTSQKLLSKMGSEQFDRNRDIKNDIIRKFFSINFSDFFEEAAI